MKKLAIGAGIVFVLLVLALVALPMLIPRQTLENRLISGVRAATGRTLAFGGDVGISLFPSLGLTARDVTLSSPPGFAQGTMIAIGGLDVRLKLLPLLGGHYDIDSFVLDKPAIALEIDKQGRPNWSFADATTPVASAAQPAAPAGAAAPSGGSGGSGPGGISLGAVKISDGTITYVDDRTGARQELDAANLTVSLASLDQPLAVTGDVTWRGQKVAATIDFARPRVLFEAGDSDADAAITSDPIKLSFKGKASGGAAPRLQGDVELDVPSLRALAQWAGGAPLNAPGSGLGPLSIKGSLDARPGDIAFSQASLALDRINATGDIALLTAGPVPSVKGTLAVDDLDLNPYLPPRRAGGGPAPGASGGAVAPAGATSGWSSEPIDPSPLRIVDLDLALSATALEVHDIKIGKSTLHVGLAAGKLTADLQQIALYGGSGTGQVVLDGSGNALGLDGSADLKGVQLGPLLTDAAQFTRLTGAGDVAFTVTGQGTSQAALVGSLGGKCAISVHDGTIKGLDLVGMIRNIGGAFTGDGDSGQTDFSDMSGTCTIASGIVTNKDLAMASPLLRVTGSGTVDLPKRTVDYRLQPKLVASLQGQGSRRDLGGIGVPVVISGPWDHLSYVPDLAGAAKSAVNGVVSGAESGGSAVGQAIGGMLGGRNQSGTGSSGSPKLPFNLFGK